MVATARKQVGVGRHAFAVPHAEAWAVAALTALAFGLRWACIHQSLFGDELILYFDVHGRSLGQVISVVHDTEKTPPLYFLLGWLFARGSSAAVLVAVPTLIASVTAVPVIYLLGARTVGRRAAFVGAAWFAISPFEVFYGTEARAYALVTMLVVVSTLSLLLALEHRRFKWWALYVVAATAAVYSHYIGALVLVPQAAWALWRHRESAREQLLSHALVVLLWLPWLPSFLVQYHHSADEAKRLSLSAPLTGSTLTQVPLKALLGFPFAALRDLPGRLPIAALAVVFAASLLILSYEVRNRRMTVRPSLSTGTGLVTLLAVFPFVCLVVYSSRPNVSFWLPRNLSVAVPYALLLFGWLLTRPRGRLAIVLPLLALGILGVGTVKGLSPTYQRPDTRAAAQFLDAHAPPAAPVFEYFWPFTRTSPAMGIRVYLKRPHSIGSFASWTVASQHRYPVFYAFTAVPALLRAFTPPKRYASQYHLVAQHIYPGIQPVAVREYAPR